MLPNSFAADVGKMMDFTGSSVVITGGASGIGAATARALSSIGARCVLFDLDGERAKELASELSGAYAVGDVANEEAVLTAVARAEELGPVRGLVNAAGVGSACRTVDRNGEPFPLELFESVIRVNLVGTFNCIRLVAAAMARTEPIDENGSRGAIVNIASLAAFEGQIGQAAYSASKGGVVGLTLPVARDLATLGIRVNSVAPGLVDTPIFGRGERAIAFKERLAANTVFPRRLGKPAEIASLVVELLTNNLLNGETVRADGALRLPPR